MFSAPSTSLVASAGRYLTVGQLDRVGAERLDHVEHQLGLLNSDAQALHVGQRADRPDAVVDRSCAGIVERQADETVALETGQDLVADRAVEHFVQVVERTEQERQRQHIGGRHQEADRRRHWCD